MVLLNAITSIFIVLFLLGAHYLTDELIVPKLAAWALVYLLALFCLCGNDLAVKWTIDKMNPPEKEVFRY